LSSRSSSFGSLGDGELAEVKVSLDFLDTGVCGEEIGAVALAASVVDIDGISDIRTGDLSDGVLDSCIFFCISL